VLRFSSREQEHDGERVRERHLVEFVGKGADDRQVAGVDRPAEVRAHVTFAGHVRPPRTCEHMFVA
jgi:hypothetical protein